MIEIDIDKEIVKKTFHYAEKYGKKVYALVSNMTIAIERRDFLRRTACFVCNQQEVGILFSEDYGDLKPEEMAQCLAKRIQSAHIPRWWLPWEVMVQLMQIRKELGRLSGYEGRCG